MIMLLISACITDQKPTDTRGSDAMDWLVQGRVCDRNAEPSEGLVVRLYDKDLTFDDELGEAITDESGKFEIAFDKHDFNDEGEKLPDLYVVVTDSKGSILYSSYDGIRPSASLIEYYIHYFDITLPAE